MGLKLILCIYIPNKKYNIYNFLVNWEYEYSPLHIGYLVHSYCHSNELKCPSNFAGVYIHPGTDWIYNDLTTGVHSWNRLDLQMI